MVTTQPSPARATNAPYCNHCGYQLTGLTESSKCPECGKPLVEVLQRGPALFRNRRYRSPIEIFGLPLVDVATGFVAIGGLARGFIAVGGFAMGLVAIGGCALGLLGALGGFALGGIAC